VVDGAIRGAGACEAGISLWPKRGDSSSRARRAPVTRSKKENGFLVRSSRATIGSIVEGVADWVVCAARG
jgi:hypothetical protein